MDRREFLLSSVALGAVACGRAQGATSPAPTSGWAAVKAQFDGLAPGLAHMAGFFLASHMRPVREAIERLRVAIDANPLEYLEEHGGEHEVAVRAAAAAYAGCAPDELALTDSTTMGLGIVYGGLALEPGEEILATTHDHIVTTLACQHRCARSGAGFRQVSLYDDPSRASTKEIVARLVAAVKPETRVVAITWVHSGTGVKLPVRAIADGLARLNAGRARPALLAVDGVHGFGIEDVNLPDLGVDYFVAGCHKWILGPRGTGLVWASPRGWAATTPAIPSMDPFWRPGRPEDMPPAAWMTPGGFHSFEHRWALDVAFRALLELGKPAVAGRIHALNRELRVELARLRKVKLMTPVEDELAAGIACFSVDGLAPAAVVAALRKADVVASTTPAFYPAEYARLAAGLINDEADVAKSLRAVAAL